MKIIFVGIHNKKGVKPLCSSTPSGKKIDAVIGRIEGVECLKVNLFDVDYMPRPQEREVLKNEFFERVPIMSDDVIVCLGSTVYDEMRDDFAGYRIIKYWHPSPLNFKTKGLDYVAGLVSMLNSVLNDERSVATEAK